MRPTSASATRSATVSLPASPAMTARSSSGEAHATASTLLPESSTITLAPSARLAARATAGSPAPDSTASETSSRASRKERGSAAASRGPPAGLVADIGAIVQPRRGARAEHRKDAGSGLGHARPRPRTTRDDGSRYAYVSYVQTMARPI